MHMRSLKRGATEKVSQPKLKKNKKRQLILTGLCSENKAPVVIFCVICLCIFFILRSMDGSSSVHRPGILGFQDQVSACAGVYAGEAILKDGLKSTRSLQT